MPIVPDTKDWTWVIERPCPECGFNPAAVDESAVATELRRNAAAWPAVLERPGVRIRPNDATWSPLEYAAHVRDVLRLYRGRLAMMLEQDDPVYPNWDQDATAVAERYNEQDPQLVATELVDAAAALAGDFDSVRGEQWQRRGRRSDGAAFTVMTFATYLVHDIVHHVWDVRG